MVVRCGAAYLDHAYEHPVGFGRVHPLLAFRQPAPSLHGLSYVLWTDASARYVIGATEVNPSSADTHTGELGVITDGHISLLKLPKSVSLTAYPDVAF